MVDMVQLLKVFDGKSKKSWSLGQLCQKSGRKIFLKMEKKNSESTGNLGSCKHV